MRDALPLLGEMRGTLPVVDDGGRVVGVMTDGDLRRLMRRVEHFPAKARARARVAAWIDDYNRQRRHSSLAMMTPADYERALQAGEAA